MENNKNKTTSEEIKSQLDEASKPILEPIDIREDIEKAEAKEGATKTNILKNEMEMRKRKAKLFLFVNLGIFVTALIAVIGLFFFLANNKSIDTNATDNDALEEMGIDVNEVSNMVRRKIDGVMVSPEADNNFLFAVMIDNHIDARPPSGLDQAHMVFEAEVEGGITRIMGIFSSGVEVGEIGPVRSARPYFVDWARELNALYTHVGGSPDALVKIDQDKILDINEFYNGQYFWRDESRYRPHNVYTSNELLGKYLEKSNADRNRFLLWNYKDDKVLEERPDSSSLNIDYRGSMFKVEWKYDKENNTYLRYVAGEPHKTRDGKFINAKNVIIQVADAIELDEKLRLDMENIGKGISLICLDGRCQPGSWEKKHPSDRTRYYFEDGREAVYNAGPTWIQVVRPGIEFKYN